MASFATWSEIAGGRVKRSEKRRGSFERMARGRREKDSGGDEHGQRKPQPRVPTPDLPEYYTP
jgi:hypothetical protein